MAKFHVPEHATYNNVLTIRKPTMAGDSPGDLLSSSKKKEVLKKRMDIKKTRNLPSMSNPISSQKAQVLNIGPDPSKGQVINSVFSSKVSNQEPKKSGMNIVVGPLESTHHVEGNLKVVDIPESKQELCQETVPRRKSNANVGVRKKIGVDGLNKKDDHRSKQVNKNFSIKTEKNSTRIVKADNEGILSSDVGNKKTVAADRIHNKNIETNKKGKDIEIHLKPTLNNDSNNKKSTHMDPFGKKNPNTGFSLRRNSHFDSSINKNLEIGSINNSHNYIKISKEADIIIDDMSHCIPDENFASTDIRQSVIVAGDKNKSVLKHSSSKTELQSASDKINGVKVNNNGKEYNQPAPTNRNKEAKTVVTKGNTKNPVKKANYKYFNKNLNSKVLDSEGKSPLLEDSMNKELLENLSEESSKTRYEEDNRHSDSKNNLKVSKDQVQNLGDMNTFDDSIIIHEELTEGNIVRKISSVRNLQDSDSRDRNSCSNISDFPVTLHKTGEKGKRNSTECIQLERNGKDIGGSKETGKSLADEILQIKLALESLPLEQLGFLDELDRELLRKEGNKKSARKKKSGTSDKKYMKPKHVRSCSEKLESLYDNIKKDNSGKDTLLHDKNFKDKFLLLNPHEHRKKRSTFGKVVRSYVSVHSFFLRKQKKAKTSCKNLRKSLSVGLLQGFPYKLNRKKEFNSFSLHGSKRVLRLKSESKHSLETNLKPSNSMNLQHRARKPYLDGKKLSLQELGAFPTSVTDSNYFQTSSFHSDDQAQMKLHKKIFSELFEVLKSEKQKSSFSNNENKPVGSSSKVPTWNKKADFKNKDKAPNINKRNSISESTENKEGSRSEDINEYGDLSKQIPEFPNQDYIDVLMRLSFSIASAITSVSTNLNKMQPMSRNDIYYYIRSYIEKTGKCDNFQELEEKGIVDTIYNETINLCQRNAFPDKANPGILKQIVEDVVNSNTNTISSMQNQVSTSENEVFKTIEPNNWAINENQNTITIQDEKTNSGTTIESKNDNVTEGEQRIEQRTEIDQTLGQSKLGQGEINMGDISQHELNHVSVQLKASEELKIPLNGNDSEANENRDGESKIASSAETVGSVSTKHISGSHTSRVRTKRNTETSSNIVPASIADSSGNENAEANTKLEDEVGSQISENKETVVLNKPSDTELSDGRCRGTGEKTVEKEEEIDSNASSEDQIKENTANKSLEMSSSANEVLEPNKRKTGEVTLPMVKPNRKLIASKVKKKESARRSAMENISRELSRIIGKSLSESKLDVYSVAEQMNNVEMLDSSLKPKELPPHQKKTRPGSQLNKKKRKQDKKQKDDNEVMEKSDKTVIDPKKGKHVPLVEKKESMKKLNLSSNTTLNNHLQNIYNAIVFGEGNYSSTVSSAKYLSNYLRKASKGSKEMLFQHWAKLCHTGQLNTRKLLIERANQKSSKKSLWTVIRETTNLILYNKK